jgi:hypothetical protein
MNRKQNKHFFECWDLMRRIEAMYERTVSPREQLEIEEMEAALVSEGGFAPFTDYQQAIQDYKDKYEDTLIDERITK